MRWMAFTMLFLVFHARAELKIVSYNIENYRASFTTDPTLLRSTILKQKPDILSVQEIVDSKGFSRFLSTHLPGYGLALSSCGGTGGQKLGFVFKKSVLRLVSFKEDRRLEKKEDLGCGSLRPAVIGVFENKRNNEFVTVIGVHLKAGSKTSDVRRRSKQYSELVKLVNSFRDGNVILTGDFNTTGFLDKNDDYQSFNLMLQKMDAITSGEYIDCTSYWSGTDQSDGIEEPSMLDHIVLTGDLKERLKNVEVGAHCKKVSCQRVSARQLGETYQSVSDHCPVGVALE